MSCDSRETCEIALMLPNFVHSDPRAKEIYPQDNHAVPTRDELTGGARDIEPRSCTSPTRQTIAALPGWPLACIMLECRSQRSYRLRSSRPATIAFAFIFERSPKKTR